MLADTVALLLIATGGYFGLTGRTSRTVLAGLILAAIGGVIGNFMGNV